MEQSVKLRLGLALLLAQIVLYYYVPKSSKGVPTTEHGEFCRVSPAEKVCFTPITALLSLCPLPRVHFTPRSIGSKDGQLEDDDDDDDDDDNDENQKVEDGGEKVQGKSFKKVQIEEHKQEENGKVNEIQDFELSAAEEKRLKEEKQSNLIYQLLVLLLVVSVTASLADCFHERSRRKANPEAQFLNSRGEPTLNRRMSLADLTMQRHARRESQASFRPPAGSKPGPEDFMGRRSSSQDNPKMPNKPPAPCRQKSCPAPFLRRLSTVDTQDARDAQDGSWAEKRRVRMIQRH